MLYNSLKDMLDSCRGNYSDSLYDHALEWIEEHSCEEQQRLIIVRDGWGKNCKAVQIEIPFPECTYYITVEAEDYKYTEFMEPREKL